MMSKSPSMAEPRVDWHFPCIPPHGKLAAARFPGVSLLDLLFCQPAFLSRRFDLNLARPSPLGPTLWDFRHVPISSLLWVIVYLGTRGPNFCSPDGMDMRSVTRKLVHRSVSSFPSFFFLVLVGDPHKPILTHFFHTPHVFPKNAVFFFLWLGV